MWIKSGSSADRPYMATKEDSQLTIQGSLPRLVDCDRGLDRVAFDNQTLLTSYALCKQVWFPRDITCDMSINTCYICAIIRVHL